jgi:hypothetical protein
MLTRPALRTILPYAAFLIVASLTFVAFDTAVAQQQQSRLGPLATSGATPECQSRLTITPGSIIRLAAIRSTARRTLRPTPTKHPFHLRERAMGLAQNCLTPLE